MNWDYTSVVWLSDGTSTGKYVTQDYMSAIWLPEGTSQEVSEYVRNLVPLLHALV